MISLDRNGREFMRYEREVGGDKYSPSVIRGHECMIGPTGDGRVPNEPVLGRTQFR